MNSTPNPVRRKWLKEVWFCLGWFVLGGGLQASDCRVTAWGVDEGLPQSSVTDVAQTPDGYIWISTLMSGISRFDGVQFVNFDSANTPAMANSGIHRLLVDRRGDLWVNDSTGNLLLRQGNTFSKVGEGVKVVSLAGDYGGRVAFSTYEGDLVIGCHAADGSWSWQHFNPSVPHGRINYYEDSDGVLWFVTAGGKLARFIGDKFEVFNSPPGLIGSHIQALARTESGAIMVGTDLELARWNHQIFTNCNPTGAESRISVRRITPVPGGFWLEADNKLSFCGPAGWHEPVADWNSRQSPWSHFQSLRPDNAGGLWVSLGNEGLAHISKAGKVERVTSEDGLPSAVVQSYFCDRQGNLWAGYHRGGLIQIRKQTFFAVTRTEGLLDTLVTSVTEDPSGAIWLGTAGGSLARWAEGKCENFNLPSSNSINQNIIACAGSDGRIWIGTGGDGLLVREHDVFRQVIAPGQIPLGVRQLLVAKDGMVWFANFSGLYRYDGKTLDCIVPTGTNDRVVAALAEAVDGSILFGTMGGSLCRWRDGKCSCSQPVDNVPSSRIWALYCETNGTVWAGTMSGGLLRFKDGQFTRFTKADGLADNDISHILADNLGNLWLGSSAGVMRVSKKSLVARTQGADAVACRIFGRNDGLPTVAMTLEFAPSCVRARDGSLWFGSTKGASQVRPDDVRASEPAPPVLVESVWADRNLREFSPTSSPAKLPEIMVEPGVNNIEVRYTTPDFIAPQLLRFKYRLEPLDADWLDADARRSVDYNHLPAGQYVFRVTAKNSDGIWNRTGASFRLVVQPHFWERKSFVLGCLVLLVATVTLVVRRITNQRLRRKLELLHQQQQIERERARIARDLHDDLGAGLTEISVTSVFAQNPALPEPESRACFQEIDGRARELVQRMDEIVWAVNPRNDSLVSLALYCCQYAKQLLTPLGLACRFDLQPGLPELVMTSEHRYSFFLAFKETINNVARHSGATELHLAIHAENDRMLFVVADNGCGFATGSERAGADGLRNIRERIERMSGRCEITSQPGAGTRVSLSVPLEIPDKIET